MSEIENEIQELIGKEINYKGQQLTVQNGKITSSGLIVLNTNKFPINFHRHSLEFKNFFQTKTQQIESKMNTENIVTKQGIPPLTTSPVVNQSLNGYDKLNNLLDNLLDIYDSGDENSKEKIKSDLDVIIPIANAKINLFKVGLTAVSIANKI